MIYEITMMKTAKFLIEADNEEAAEQQASDWCIEALDASDNISFVGEGIEEIDLHTAIKKYGQFHRPINTLRSLDEILRPEEVA